MGDGKLMTANTPKSELWGSRERARARVCVWGRWRFMLCFNELWYPTV